MPARHFSGEPHLDADQHGLCTQIIKHKLGKLPLPKPPQKYIPSKRKQHEIDSIPLDEEAALYLTKLPGLHKDPFDWILICQAIVAGFIILTPDELITQHPLRSLW